MTETRVRRPLRIPILQYHAIGTADDDARSDPVYLLPPAAFAEQMQCLRQLGYRTIDLEALGEWARGAGEVPEKSVAITFDDGDASNATAACPVLAEHGFGATFFLTAGFMGQPGWLSWAQIAEMLATGMRIGSHGMTHAYLSELNDLQLEKELAESRDLIEGRTHTRVKALSLPGGFGGRRVRRMAAQAGYEQICTSTFGDNRPGADLLALRRLPVRAHTDLSEFRKLLELGPGTYARYRGRQMALRTARTLLGSSRYARLRRRALGGRGSDPGAPGGDSAAPRKRPDDCV